MKKIILGFLVFLSATSVYAWPRLGQGATTMLPDTGRNKTDFTATVGTSTVQLLYSGNNNDREILIQNTSSTYAVYLASYSTVRSGSGPRIRLNTNEAYTTNNTANIYGILDSSAGSATVEVLGSVEYDPKDR